MAVAIQTYSTATGTTSFVLTKPTGLAVGDFMVCVRGVSGTTNQPSFADLAGWTSQENLAGFEFTPNSSAGLRIDSKVADSSDVAASDFTFTQSGTGISGGAILIRIDGVSPSTPYVNDSGGGGYNSGSSSSTSIAGFTPSFADCLYLMCIFNSKNGSFSSYAIATDNPSWTNLTTVTNGARNIAVAYASRPQATATGNFSWSYGSDTAIWSYGVLVALKPIQNVDIASDLVSVSVSTPSVTVQTGVNVAIGSISITVTVNTPVVRNITEWLNEDKGSAVTWENEDK